MSKHNHLLKAIERASELSILLVLLILLCLRFYRRHLEGPLRGILFPERRRQSLPLYFADRERRRPPLRPIQLVFPVTALQITIFIAVALLHSEQALFHAGILNLFIAAFAMLPSIRHNTIA